MRVELCVAYNILLVGLFYKFYVLYYESSFCSSYKCRSNFLIRLIPDLHLEMSDNDVYKNINFV
jgi:hypothetical protein